MAASVADEDGRGAHRRRLPGQEQLDLPRSLAEPWLTPQQRAEDTEIGCHGLDRICRHTVGEHDGSHRHFHRDPGALLISGS